MDTMHTCRCNVWVLGGAGGQVFSLAVLVKCAIGVFFFLNSTCMLYGLHVCLCTT